MATSAKDPAGAGPAGAVCDPVTGVCRLPARAGTSLDGGGLIPLPRTLRPLAALEDEDGNAVDPSLFKGKVRRATMSYPREPIRSGSKQHLQLEVLVLLLLIVAADRGRLYCCCCTSYLPFRTPLQAVFVVVVVYKLGCIGWCAHQNNNL